MQIEVKNSENNIVLQEYPVQSANTNSADETDSFPLAVGVLTEDEQICLSANSVPSAVAKEIKAQLALLEASSKVGEITKLVLHKRLVFAVGLGEGKPSDLRKAAGAVVRAARKLSHLVIDFAHDSSAEFSAIALGTLLGKYKFTKYLSTQSESETKITVFTSVDNAPALLEKVQLISTATNNVRDLTNLPANELNPQTFAEYAENRAKEANLSVKIYTGEELETEKLSGLLAVGSGSKTPPRLIRVAWEPASAKQHIALVGKGITFDTGGYSLKPSSAITEMKTDMCGAATVLETVAAVAQLNLPVRVVSWLCLAENMVSSTASRPDDVIVYRNGKSVEINNTDAEGRLVMADGLIMASAEKPDAVIDIATLTGAQMVALGEKISGIMGDDDVRDALIAAAQEADEDAWAMPLPPDLRDSLKSEIADLKNSGTRYGGMLVAGVFLREFVDVPWAHIDIAGPSFNRHSDYDDIPAGATGVMLRTLVQYIAQCAK